ncbi:hypothetical protein HDU77_007780 [Chytriomyces hyalinus]|nr:hypothetical protein HDU77_007780 [Chytriomyces hyalinus]
MILTESLILSKAKGFSRTAASTDLSQIQSINLWGQNLIDVSCLERLVNLRVVSLPVNKISDLSVFATLPHLSELYLRKNEISDPRQLLHLTRLHHLTHLWISENPVCLKIPNYRLSMIRIFPQLSKLDDQPVTDRERKDAAKLDAAISVNTTSVQSKPAPMQNSSKVTATTAKPIPLTQKSTRNSMYNLANRIDEEDESIGSIHARYEAAKVQDRRQSSTLPASRSFDEPINSKSRHSDERPIRPGSSYKDQMLALEQSHNSKADPYGDNLTYDSRILRDKHHRDHFDVRAGLNVLQIPIDEYVDNRRRTVESKDHQELRGAGARVQATLREQTDFRMKDMDWDECNNHLKGAGVTVQKAVQENSNFRRSNVDALEGKGSLHVSGASAAVDYFPLNAQKDFRMRHLAPREEMHVSGAGVSVQAKNEFHDAKLGFPKHANEHLQGSGLTVLRDEDLFPVQFVDVDTTVRASKYSDNAAFNEKRKPEWLQNGDGNVSAVLYPYKSV